MKNIKNVYLIKVNNSNYEGISEKEFSAETGDCFLFKKGASQGGDFTPTSRINKDANSKTFKVDGAIKRIESCLKNLLTDIMSIIYMF